MKIPRLQRVQQQNTVIGRPTESPGQASQGARQMAQLANQATNVFGQIQQRRKQAETSDYKTTSTLAFNESVYEKQKELSERYSGDYKGYSQEMEKFVTKQEEDLLNTAPNEDARRLMKGRLDNLSFGVKTNAQEFENKKRAENFINNQKRIVENTSTRYYQDPNPIQALKELPMTLVDLEESRGVTLSDEGVNQLKGQYINTTRDSLLNGMIDKGMYNQAEEVLNSDQFSEIRQGMDAKELASFTNKIKTKKEQLFIEKVTQVKTQAENAIAFNLSGSGLDPDMRSQIMNVGAEIQNLPDSEEKTVLMDRFQKSLTVSNSVEIVKDLSLEQIAQIDVAELIPGDLDTYRSDAKFRNSLKSAVARNLQERNADSAAYLEKTNPDLTGPSNINRRIARAKQLGISEIRGISKEESARQIQVLTGGPTATDKSLALDNVLKSYGDGANRALADMVKDGLDPSYMLAATFNDNSAKTRILDNFTNKKSLNEDFKTTREKLERDEVASASTEIVQDTVASIRSSFGDSQSSSAMVNSIREVVELEAKSLMVKDSGLSAGDAVEKAFDNTVARQWNTVSYESEGKRPHRALVPKNVDKRNVEAFMKHYSVPEGLKTLGVEGKRYPSFAGSDEEFREMISENSYFTTNETQDGLYLRFTDPSGIEDFVQDSQGNRVEVKFDEMATERFSKVLDERNSLFFSPKRLGEENTPARSLSGKVN